MAVFTPHFKLDLGTASAQAFDRLLTEFEEWRASLPDDQLPAVDLTNGWKTITPEIAEAMLLRNRVGANRKPTLPTVKHYARMQQAQDWIATGQSLLFSEGELKEGAHRLWASYLSGSTFPTFVIGDVPNHPALFAYLDAGKPRSAADALATAGLNGAAKTIAPTVSMALQYENHCYTPSIKKPMAKISPMEVVRYAQSHENLRYAARLMAGEYKPASTVIGYKDVASFTAFQILELHDEEVLENFMTDLGTIPDEPVDGNPLDALRKVLDDDANSADPMKKHQVLGYVIKAFNHWLNNDSVKRLSVRVNDAYPRFQAAAPTRIAAE